MAVRVRLRVRFLGVGREVTTVALVNSGFETEEPQLLVPDRLLLMSGVDASTLKGSVVEYGTAAGTISMYVVRRGCSVSVVEPDRRSREVVADLVISPIEREVLISDALGEELGIMILSLKKGLWRFTDDGEGKLRNSYSPQYW